MSDFASVPPAVGVGAILFDRRGRVLLIRRGGPPKAGYWSVPGGRMEPGETLAECCRREVLEETGLAVEPGPITAIAHRDAESFHYLIVDFAARVPGDPPPEPRAGTDAAAALWVDMADLGDYDLVEGLVEAIDGARRCLDEGGGLVDTGGTGRLFLPSF